MAKPFLALRGIQPFASTISLAALLFLSMSNLARSETIYIGPGEALTRIQAAIDAASDGDLIIVRDGTYTGSGNRDVTFRGKAVHLKSQNGPSKCIIDPQRTWRAFYFGDGEGRDSIVDGFTMTDGCGNSGGGGAILVDSGCSPTIMKNWFIGNAAAPTGGNHGGAIRANSNALIINNIFVNNIAAYGGAIAGSTSGGPTVINNTIVNNSASWWGGGLFRVKNVRNCIIRGNAAGRVGPQIYEEGTLTYSNVEGGHTGTGNVDVDPLFASPGALDYHLKSQHGRWDPDANIGAGGWVTDAVSSPCLDAGDPADDCFGEPEPNGGRIEMGVYGNTSQASKSPGRTLSVQSSPAGITVAGTKPGITNFTATCYEGQVVNLTAPVTATVGGARYSFARWQLDGSDQPDGQLTVQTVMTAAHVAKAVYAVQTFTLTVDSAPSGCIQITGSKPGMTRYSAACSEQQPVNLLAPDSAIVEGKHYSFLHWTVDGQPVAPGTSLAIVMDSNHTVVAQYQIRTYTLTVQSSPVPGMSITGDKPGTTNYTEICDDHDLVTLVAPAVRPEGYVRYEFSHWTINGTPMPAGQASVQITMDQPVTAVAVYTRIAPEAILKGPVERGEPSPLSGGGTFTVDVCLKNVYGLFIMQAGLKITDSEGHDAGFTISTANGTFGGLAIDFNAAAWPDSYPYAIPGGFAVAALGDPVDFVAETRLFTVTYDYGPAAIGTYAITLNSSITTLYDGACQIVATDAVPGSVTIIQKQVLTVQSTPVPGISLTGTRPGTTSYTAACSDQEAVSLSAPTLATVSGVEYTFLRWTLDGVEQAYGDRNLQVTMDGPRTATAVYRLAGDVNGDCRVNILDLLTTRSRLWLNPENPKNLDAIRQADVNGDGTVSILDLIFTRNRLGANCP